MYRYRACTGLCRYDGLALHSPVTGTWAGIHVAPGGRTAQRRIVFRSFTPPSSPGERYALAAWMAAYIAFQLAVWHEIAQ
nr:DUF4056 domain-containing protein [Salmonella enterica]